MAAKQHRETDLARLARAFRDLAERMSEMRAEYLQLPPGKYEDCTIYTVRRHVVRSFTRARHVRMRIKR